MKEGRTANATRNAIFGVAFKVVTILVPFVIRTLMIYIMGAEYVGLNSLFTSLLSFLSLADLGIGQALVYSMYKPIACSDKEQVSALLNLYKKLYRLIGTIILIVGICLVPFLKYLVKDGCPEDVNVYVLYGIYLLNTIISYWLFGYKQSLLVANQRSDIVSKRSLIVQSAMYLFQISALWISRNYYVYIIMLPVFTVVTNLANSVIVDKMYPEYKCEGTVSKELESSIRKKVIALFGTKANSVIMHALDNIVISAFLGLAMVGKYGNYYYIMNAIIGVMTTIYSSLTAGLGNSIVTDTKEKVYRDFDTLSFMNACIVTFCTVSLLCLYQPFMKIWVGDDLMLEFGIVLLLVVYFYVYQIRRIVLTYKDAGGIWWEDRFRPYVMMLTNLIGNFVMVQIIGLYGVILSTIIAMCVSWPWEIYTLFKYVFHASSKMYYRKLLQYILFTVVVASASWGLCSLTMDGILGLFIKAIICVAVSMISIVTVFRRTDEYHAVVLKVKAMLK